MDIIRASPASGKPAQVSGKVNAPTAQRRQTRKQLPYYIAKFQEHGELENGDSRKVSDIFVGNLMNIFFSNLSSQLALKSDFSLTLAQRSQEELNCS